jgi:hypothetical protein
MEYLHQSLRVVACLLAGWVSMMPCAHAEAPPEAAVRFVPADASMQWSLVGPDDGVLCRLPCTLQLRPESSYRLRLEFPKSPDRLVLALPPGPHVTPGKSLEVRPFLGLSRPAKLTMQTIGFVLGGLFALLEIPVALDHFSTSAAAPCWGAPRSPAGGCAGETVSSGVGWASGVGTISALFLALGVVGSVLPETHLDIHAVTVP